MKRRQPTTQPRDDPGRWPAVFCWRGSIERAAQETVTQGGEGLRLLLNCCPVCHVGTMGFKPLVALSQWAGLSFFIATGRVRRRLNAPQRQVRPNQAFSPGSERLKCKAGRM